MKNSARNLGWMMLALAVGAAALAYAQPAPSDGEAHVLAGLIFFFLSGVLLSYGYSSSQETE